MKPNLLLTTMLGFLLLGSFVHAHPPSDIQLEYKLAMQVLHIQMRHTTHDPREDFIRKIQIIKNAEEPLVKRYNIQPNTLEFSADIELEAEVGDLITVKAFSREGGTAVQSITISEEEAQDQTSTNKDMKRKSKRKLKGSGY